MARAPSPLALIAVSSWPGFARRQMARGFERPSSR